MVVPPPLEPIPSGLKTEIPSGSDCDLFGDDSSDDDDNLRGVSNVVYRQEYHNSSRFIVGRYRAFTRSHPMFWAWEERVRFESSSTGMERERIMTQKNGLALCDEAHQSPRIQLPATRPVASGSSHSSPIAPPQHCKTVRDLPNIELHVPHHGAALWRRALLETGAQPAYARCANPILEGRFSEEYTRKIVRDILNAICYLHETKNIAHRDLKYSRPSPSPQTRQHHVFRQHSGRGGEADRLRSEQSEDPLPSPPSSSAAASTCTV